MTITLQALSRKQHDVLNFTTTAITAITLALLFACIISYNDSHINDEGYFTDLSGACSMHAYLSISMFGSGLVWLVVYCVAVVRNPVTKRVPQQVWTGCLMGMALMWMLPDLVQFLRYPAGGLGYCNVHRDRALDVTVDRCHNGWRWR